ncbi:sulfotransferase family 2 domain-containing protein [Vibrio sp. 1CM23M]|uniref:sulfotransferase family 2 domain-containing protein n=1 Tax=Vibrio sp. 1CM23M TaxID=2929164 RepID=UPI0020BDE9A4|nr:sulfotransferase family 2 domain-containing protein [Vibrio sp. 1CM23M]MCK8073698.1 sulfotransferase family protein [Vibrio sp. 1CM23M]
MTNLLRVYLQNASPYRETLSCINSTCGCRVSNFIWVSHIYNIIYIETPKCACSSIKSSLGLIPNEEMFIFSYLMLNRRYLLKPDTRLALSPIGFGYRLELSTSEVDGLVNSVSMKIEQGNYCTDPMGEFGFCHYFGDVDTLIKDNPDYKLTCVVRDPIDRFMSGLNMFYDPDGFKNRRIQRVNHSMALRSDISNINDIVDDIVTYPNHHFSPITDFIGSNTTDIEFIDIKNVNAWLSHNFGIVKPLRKNVNNGYVFDRESLGEDTLNRIKDIYSKDYEVIASIS